MARVGRYQEGLATQAQQIVLAHQPQDSLVVHGKTTAADLFRREIGQRVVIVPEAATLLFAVTGLTLNHGPEHMYRALLYGSYKSPRELLWVIGMFIGVVVAAIVGAVVLSKKRN